MRSAMRSKSPTCGVQKTQRSIAQHNTAVSA
jgi:hypothetical protein